MWQSIGLTLLVIVATLACVLLFMLCVIWDVPGEPGLVINDGEWLGELFRKLPHHPRVDPIWSHRLVRIQVAQQNKTTYLSIKHCKRRLVKIHILAGIIAADDFILKGRMVWVERDLKDHLVPTPCHGQGHLPLGVAQAPSNLALNASRDGTSTASLCKITRFI
ncbi:hypothetical protein BTVI_63908 [Pitangus sulphuratus]|nr:hypothetical protein BTVI_63908 [Pitangus sulphuratus]